MNDDSDEDEERKREKEKKKTEKEWERLREQKRTNWIECGFIGNASVPSDLLINTIISVYLFT